MLRIFLLFVSCLFSLFVLAQSVSIPAFTGYAIPAEKDGEEMFSVKNGLHWTDAQQQISYSFYVHKAGRLSIALKAKNNKPGSQVQLSLTGKEQVVSIPASVTSVWIKAGMVTLKDSGFYTLVLRCVKKAGAVVADISTIELGGAAAASIHYNPKPRRNAASVHLRYPLPDSVKAAAFYNEITVPQGADLVHSYYMTCGFARGYFGIQVNSADERRVIFSVWDSGNEAVDRNKVADSNKVQLLARGENVFADGFGNEGTGGHSHWVYNWKAGVTYPLLVTALADSATRTTIYTGYFFLPELQQWKLIASFRAPHDGKNLRNLYSFSENFVGLNGQLQRKVFFSNPWIQRDNGSWKEITQSSFSYDATGKAGDRIDYGAGVANNRFYIWNGGFQKANAAYGDLFNRIAEERKPNIDWTKNADSIVQAEKDRQLILAAIHKKEIDTTGSTDGLYYQLIQTGSGETVSVNDTVTVYYKGSLLKDGSIFDQTREAPATFPLKKLIRGWQIGVPLCRVGGKIRLIIPSALAYTIRSRSKSIPPNSVLVFDIEVLGRKKG